MKKAERKLLEASPNKLLTEELEKLRAAARELTGAFLRRTEEAIDEIREKAAAGVGKEAHARDLRDMLILVRGLDLKPPAGRRKDFKKIETAIDEMRLLAHKW